MADQSRITFDASGLNSRQQSWTLQGFESYEQFIQYGEVLKVRFSRTDLNEFLEAEKRKVNQDLVSNTSNSLYGIPNAQGVYDKKPRSYDEAMGRDEFVYWDEYNKIKERISSRVLDELAKNSTAEAMKDKMVFNDMELGDFIFDRAAMGLLPQIFYYSPTHKRVLQGDELDIKSKNYALLIEKQKDGSEKMFLKSDHTPIVAAIEVETESGTKEYVEVNGEAELSEASERGVVNATSDVKKSYLYKQKQPRLNNAIRIVLGMTRGGFSSWDNDFYGGVAACIVTEVLESLGYLVSVDIAFGGGRCSGCVNLGKRLNTRDGSGRRFFLVSAKNLSENLNLDRLLYMACDPSFHTVKLASYINCFFQLYGDMKDNSSTYWHGIERGDLRTPIGAAMMAQDMKVQNTDVMYYLIHRVANETEVAQAVLDIVLNAETENMKLKEKAFSYAV
jgi:hypothetical protein